MMGSKPKLPPIPRAPLPQKAPGASGSGGSQPAPFAFRDMSFSPGLIGMGQQRAGRKSLIGGTQ